ncbi:MAG TPA: DUF790 family protein, partial [Longimicrobiales bacterium]|nr:DUF790 family protein [Longimicrobiales bacterium]
MLRRPHVEPFLREADGELRVEFLRDPDGRVVAFLARLLKLVRRLEGRPRRVVVEALRRQERRVRDAPRLAGIAKTLLDLCAFGPPPGAERAPAVREALFRARAGLWPPVPGDDRLPYEVAAERLGIEPAEVERLLYADAHEARLLLAAPAALDGQGLLDRYNLELARGVLLDAERLALTARGGWRGIFRALKLARLMFTVERVGRRGYRVEATGPAAAFVARPQRYGARLARVVPALLRAPGWQLEAEVVRAGRRLAYRLDAATAPIPRPRGRRSYDSRWERDLARDFGRLLPPERSGWSLTREDAPVVVGGEVFLPDFTLRHRDGREALVEVVGFWTPEYLDVKLRKVAAAGLDHLVLVVYRGLAAGAPARVEAETAGPVVWFRDR